MGVPFRMPGRSVPVDGRESTADENVPVPCGSYGPGHLMHWIQRKKSCEDGQPIVKVKVVAVHDDGCVEIEGDDVKLTVWHHDPDRLRSALMYAGSIPVIGSTHATSTAYLPIPTTRRTAISAVV